MSEIRRHGQGAKAAAVEPVVAIALIVLIDVRTVCAVSGNGPSGRRLSSV